MGDALPTIDLNGSALPVELVAFTAQPDGASVRLVWTTASDTNNAGFGVEVQPAAAEARSALSLHDTWRELACVPGRGITSEAHTYAHRLDGLGAGFYRVRLRQVDVRRVW